jgi:effector-binding domain-containing protein
MKRNFITAMVIAGSFLLISSTVKTFSQDPESKCTSSIEIKQVDAQKAIVIKADVPTANIGTAIGEAYGKLFGFLGSQNIAPAGTAFAVYYSFDPKGNTIFEAGVPVNAQITGNEEITYKEFPAMKVVSTLFKGAYDKMEPVYQKIDAYIKENKLESTGISWEVYLTDPSQVSDPNDNQTIIYFPVK